MIEGTDRALEKARALDLGRSGYGRTIRIARGLSLRDVAAACGASASGVLRWERGQRRPKGAAGLRWAAFIEQLAQGPGR